MKYLGLLVLSIILCLPAFENGFPLMHPDTSAYLIAGFDSVIGEGRTWPYAGFLRHISLSESLWLVVFVQSSLMLGCLDLFFKAFFDVTELRKYLLPFYVFVVAVPTALSFHVSCLMPDVFTPIMLLSFLILLLAPQQSKKEKACTISLFLMALVMHNTHLILALVFIILLWISYLIPVFRHRWQSALLSRNRLIGLSGLLVIGLLTLSSLHYMVGGEFRATRGGGVFLFARLCDYGIAQDYLKVQCPDSDYFLCQQKHSLGLGRHFLWDRKKVFHQQGGWTTQNEALYAQLCFDILSHPNYLKKYLLKTTIATLNQFFCYDFSPLDENHHSKWLANEVSRRFPDSINEVQNSKQYLGLYRPEMADNKNNFQHLLILFSLFLIGIYGFVSRWKFNRFWLFTGGLLFGLFLNALLSAATSGVYPRYQSRLAWMLTLPAFWVVCQYMPTQWISRKG